MNENKEIKSYMIEEGISFDYAAFNGYKVGNVNIEFGNQGFIAVYQDGDMIELTKSAKSVKRFLKEVKS